MKRKKRCKREKEKESSEHHDMKHPVQVSTRKTIVGAKYDDKKQVGCSITDRGEGQEGRQSLVLEKMRNELPKFTHHELQYC